jgi:hypothetical protein
MHPPPFPPTILLSLPPSSTLLIITHNINFYFYQSHGATLDKDKATLLKAIHSNDFNVVKSMILLISEDEEYDQAIQSSIDAKAWNVSLTLLGERQCSGDQYNRVLDAVVASNNLNVAMKLLFAMQINAFLPNLECTYDLIKLNCHHGEYDDAIEVLELYKQTKEFNYNLQHPDDEGKGDDAVVTVPLYELLLQQLGKANVEKYPKAGKVAFDLVGQMLLEGTGVSAAAWNHAILATAKSGEWTKSYDLLSNMKTYFVEPAGVSYSACIAALTLYAKPDATTDGKRADLAYTALRQMEFAGFDPQLLEYNLVLSLAMQGGKYDLASKVVSTLLTKKHFQLNQESFDMGLKSLYKKGEGEKAKLLLSKCLGSGLVKPSPENIDAIINMCAEKGNWQTIDEVFELAVSHKVTADPVKIGSDEEDEESATAVTVDVSRMSSPHAFAAFRYCLKVLYNNYTAIDSDGFPSKRIPSRVVIQTGKLHHTETHIQASFNFPFPFDNTP